MTCTHASCPEPSVGPTDARWWGQCARHAVIYADANLARAQAERDSLRPYERGQLDLLESA